jgi:pSer/pThr/pTyr-binding forkhead associated (FHA) protein
MDIAGLTEEVTNKIALFISGETFLLDSNQNYVLGRSKNCDVVIANNMVSRSHCRIFSINSKWFLEDLGSSRGTYIGSKKIERIELNGDVQGSIGGIDVVNFEIKVLTNKISTSEKLNTITQVNRKSVGLTGRIPLLNRMRIGKNQDNDWVINDVNVSDYHAEINMTSPGNYEITDMNSESGTFVNGKKIKRIKLRTGDQVLIGNVERRFTNDGLETAEGTEGASIKLQNLYYATENGTWLMKNINLHFAAASLTAVVGPSGAGKSTLMDLLTGRKKATVGNVEFSNTSRKNHPLLYQFQFVWNI